MNATNPRSGRWWMPIATVLLGFAAFTGWWQYPELPFVSRMMYSALTVAVGLLLLLVVWFLFLSAFRWRTRFLTLGILLLAGFGFSKLVRVDGAVNGSGLPHITWKWTPRSDGNVALARTIAAQPAAAGDEATPAVGYPGFLGTDPCGFCIVVEHE